MNSFNQSANLQNHQNYNNYENGRRSSSNVLQSSIYDFENSVINDSTTNTTEDVHSQNVYATLNRGTSPRRGGMSSTRRAKSMNAVHRTNSTLRRGVIVQARDGRNTEVGLVDRDANSSSPFLQSSDEATTSVSSGNNDPLRKYSSQAVMWYTTVPQPIISHSLSSRHEPTRRSLRHSRMIVRAQKGAVPRKYLPPIIDRHRFATALSMGQMTLGSASLALSLWLISWAPLVAANDPAMFSGISLCLSSIWGLILMNCYRFRYPGTRRIGCVFTAKTRHIIFGLVISCLASIHCLISFILHSYHLYELFFSIPYCLEEPFGGEDAALVSPFMRSHFSRASDASLHKTCICSHQSMKSLIHRDDSQEASQILRAMKARTFFEGLRYPGLSCKEVKHFLPLVITGESVINFMGIFLAAWFFGVLLFGFKDREMEKEALMKEKLSARFNSEDGDSNEISTINRSFSLPR